MLIKIPKFIKKPLVKIYNFYLNISWRIRQKNHNVTPINRLYFPFANRKVHYELKTRKIKYSSLIEIYKINNLYKPKNNYVFYSPYFRSFISENWIWDFKTNITKKRKNIDFDKKNTIEINFKKPVFFISSTNVYSYFIFWNIFNILFFIKNNISFDIVVHENLKKEISFNKNFVKFLKKYLNLRIIYLNPNRNILIKSEVLLLNNYLKFAPYKSNKIKSHYMVFPKEIIKDLPSIIIKNRKLKKFFGKPRNDVVLISREDSRIIKNEKELLEKIPIIKRIVPEKLTIEEEISFAYHAKVIIAPFGAAISNIFFARPDCALIRLKFKKINQSDTKVDLFSDYTKFEMMAENKGMKYFLQDHGNFHGSSTQKNSYFYVDIKKIENLLKKII